MPTLCSTFRGQASLVWNNMHKAASRGMWLSEETLTEWVQYNIALLHQGDGFVVDLATKPKEAKHGGDWEWWFVRNNVGHGFRVQAKRLFPSKRYESLFKSGAVPYEQLDKLIAVAARDNLIPLYCFYNYRHAPNEFAGIPNLCRHNYRQPSFWGCSLALPANVKAAGSNRLRHLKRLMSPWHQLVCRAASSTLLQAVEGFVRDRHPERHVAPRELPPRVQHLIELSDQRRESPEPSFIDEAFWAELSETDREDLSGVITYRDIRGE